MKGLICAVAMLSLSLSVGCSDSTVNRYGKVACEIQLDVRPAEQAALVRELNAVGSEFRLSVTRNADLERALRETQDIEHAVFYSLVQRRQSDSALVLHATTLGFVDERIGVQVYDGALSSSATQQLCQRLSRVESNWQAHSSK